MELIVTNPDQLQKLIEDAVSRAVSDLQPTDGTSKKEIFTNRQAMQFLGVSRSTLQRWRNDGTLPYRKVSGSIRYTRSDLKVLLDESKQ